jgi:hypothetical protein
MIQTPAQRKYDHDFAAAMRVLAQRIRRHSRKISDTLVTAAERIEALSAGAGEPVNTSPRQHRIEDQSRTR